MPGRTNGILERFEPTSRCRHLRSFYPRNLVEGEFSEVPFLRRAPVHTYERPGLRSASAKYHPHSTILAHNAPPGASSRSVRSVYGAVTALWVSFTVKCLIRRPLLLLWYRRPCWVLLRRLVFLRLHLLATSAEKQRRGDEHHGQRPDHPRPIESAIISAARSFALSGSWFFHKAI